MSANDEEGHVKFIGGSPWSEGRAKSEDDSDVVLGVPRSPKKEKTGCNNNQSKKGKCEEASKGASMCGCDEASEVVGIGASDTHISLRPASISTEHV